VNILRAVNTTPQFVLLAPIVDADLSYKSEGAQRIQLGEHTQRALRRPLHFECWKSGFRGSTGNFVS
jgi:hypothetical protein